MKKILLTNILLVSILLTEVTFAASPSYTGKIKEILSGPVYGTKVFIKIDVTIDDKPACATNWRWNYIFDTELEHGKSYLSLLMMAKAQNSTITIQGTSVCSLWPNVENLRYFVIS